MLFFKLAHFFCVCRYALRRRMPSSPTLLMSWLCIKRTPTHETALRGSTWCVDIFMKLFRISPSTWSPTWQRLVHTYRLIFIFAEPQSKGDTVIVDITASQKVLNKWMVFNPAVTAVGQRSPQYAADPVTNHPQPPESHGPEWDSSQNFQHGGAQDNWEICPGESKHLNVCPAADN